MEIGELILVGIGLAMDAFAAAICQGLMIPEWDMRRSGQVACTFGVFQAMMPLLGWLLGARFASATDQVDHWVAFILLSGIGVGMVWTALGEEEERDTQRNLFWIGLATSVDALSVGVTFAFLEVPVVAASAVIGAITWVLSLAGVAAGHLFGGRYRRSAELMGGLLLMSMGLRILLEHLRR